MIHRTALFAIVTICLACAALQLLPDEMPEWAPWAALAFMFAVLAGALESGRRMIARQRAAEAARRWRH